MSTPRWIEPPDDLPETARTYWKHYASGLRANGELTPERCEKFALLCRLLALVSAASASMEADGVTIRSKTGVAKANPAAAVLLSTQRPVRDLMHAFGIG